METVLFVTVVGGVGTVVALGFVQYILPTLSGHNAAEGAGLPPRPWATRLTVAGLVTVGVGVIALFVTFAFLSGCTRNCLPKAL